MEVAGKIALITGGARIGQAVAEALARRGCGLALTYRSSRAAAEAAAAAAREAGVRTAVLHADVTDEAQVTAAVRDAERELGRLDILVNLAATYERTPLAGAGARAFSDAMDANARSAWLFAIHAAPAMRRAGSGRIVNVSDWLPVSGRPFYAGYTPYYVSKAAVPSTFASSGSVKCRTTIVPELAAIPLTRLRGRPGERPTIRAACRHLGTRRLDESSCSREASSPASAISPG